MQNIKEIPHAVGIYRIVNLLNNKCYVGQSSDFRERVNQHLNDLRTNKHHSRYLQRSYNQHGESNFQFEILEIIELVPDDRNFMNDREQYWINYYDSANSKGGYNIAPVAGTCLGVKHSDETRAKISGENNHNFEKHFSEEHRAKLSESNKGKHVIENETREKLSKSHIGQTHTTEQRIKMSLSNSKQRYIVVSPDRKAYAVRSMIAFCASFGLNPKNMNSIVRQKVTHHKNYIVRYMTQDEANNYSVLLQERHYAEIDLSNDLLYWYYSRLSRYIIVNPYKITFIVKNIDKFCEVFNLSRNHVTSVANENRPHHKGYKIRRMTIEEIIQYESGLGDSDYIQLT